VKVSQERGVVLKQVEQMLFIVTITCPPRSFIPERDSSAICFSLRLLGLSFFFPCFWFDRPQDSDSKSVVSFSFAIRPSYLPLSVRHL
jgi:hypothetical protein